MIDKLTASIIFSLLTAFAGLAWKLPNSYRIIHPWLQASAYCTFFVLMAYDFGRTTAATTAYPFVIKAGSEVLRQYDAAERATRLDWWVPYIGFFGVTTYLGLLRHGSGLVRYLRDRFEQNDQSQSPPDK